MTQLSPADAAQAVKDAIAAVAPELSDEIAALDPTVDLWDLLQLDSMDHQNVMVEIFERTGIEIGEREYPMLRSLDALVDRLASAAAPG